MNIRKPIDYSAMYTGLDQALERNLPHWVDAECGYHGGRPGYGSAALVSSGCFAVRMVKGGAAAADQRIRA